MCGESDTLARVTGYAVGLRLLRAFLPCAILSCIHECYMSGSNST